MKAIIILPTFNEKENIDKLIPFLEEEIFPHIKNHEMHILVADDSSPDGTEEEVEKFAKKWKNIHLSIGEKKGLGAAYIRAMDYAVSELSADVVFEMDADLQHDPQKIPDFLKKIDEGADMVLGNRYSDGGSIPQKWPLMRKVFSVVANLFVRIIFTKFSIHDWTGGYRALRKEVFLKERDELTKFKGYIFQISFLHKAVRDGFKVAEVPFHFGERNAGDSKIAPLGYILEVVSFVITTRVKELASGSFGKFIVVGGIGFVINALVLRSLVEGLKWAPATANLVGAACAIFSNFNLNNLWTFSERKTKNILSYLSKLLQFYATSAFGVIFIQTGIIFLGDTFITRKYYFFYFIVGTGFLLIYNFIVYSLVIWKKKKK